MQKNFTGKQFDKKIYFFGFYGIRFLFTALGIGVFFGTFLHNNPLCAPFGLFMLLLSDVFGIHYSRFFAKQFPAYFRTRSIQEIKAFWDQIRSEFFVYVVCVSIAGPYIAIVQKETTLLFVLIVLTAIFSYIARQLPHIETFEIKH